MTEQPFNAFAADAADKKIRKLNQQLLLLWCFLEAEEMWDDAREYLDEHDNDELPFTAEWMI